MSNVSPEPNIPFIENAILTESVGASHVGATSQESFAGFILLAGRVEQLSIEVLKVSQRSAILEARMLDLLKTMQLLITGLVSLDKNLTTAIKGVENDVG